MSTSEIILLFGAAATGGAVNSVAGGGGFIAFPSLLFTGMPPINANATSTIALWPGTLASTGAYRRALSPALLKRVMPLIVITFLGSFAGSFLLLKTPQQTFLKMVPWLLLGATLLFSFGSRITAWVSRHHAQHGPSVWAVAGITVLQAIAAIYIGYFGAGVGIVILALLLHDGTGEHSQHERPQDPARYLRKRRCCRGVHLRSRCLLAAGTADDGRSNTWRLWRGLLRPEAESKSRTLYRDRNWQPYDGLLFLEDERIVSAQTVLV